MSSSRVPCYCCGTETKDWGANIHNVCGACNQKIQDLMYPGGSVNANYEDGYSKTSYNKDVLKFIEQIKAERAKSQNSFFGKVKADAVNAGYRIAATQISQGIKTGLLALMKEQGMESGAIAALSEMLDTEMGGAIVSCILGYSLAYIPTLDKDPRVQHLAQEFRTDGMMIAGNTIMDAAFTHLMPVVNEVMENLPELPAAKEDGKAASI